ncbi:MAG: LapA family protein [Calditrichaeota bacterium]|nr:MAG: LapA family protein [Calditrichota bacterium]
MKVLLTLIKILLIVLILFVLTQNAGQFVDIKLLTYQFNQVNLYVVIIVSFTIGAILGVLFMAMSYLQSRSEVRALKKANRQLTRELESLRNVSIEEIPEEDLPPAVSEGRPTK